jgi:hypothetical protein
MGTTEIFEEAPGSLKFQTIAGDAFNYFRVTADVKPDGSGFSSTTPEFKTNMEVPEKDRWQLEAAKEMFTKALESGVSAIGKPLRQGSVEGAAEVVCKFFPGSSGVEKMSGGYRVLGTTFERGRENIVFGGERSVSCRMPGTLWHMHEKGWDAIDRLSGLVAGRSSRAILSVDGLSGTGDVTEDTECVVTGEVVRALKGNSPLLENTSTPGSSEQRLLELKSLLDKGLITKEQYEKKSAEILKTL